jgi:hypothetical protein
MAKKSIFLWNSKLSKNEIFYTMKYFIYIYYLNIELIINI